MQLRIRFTFIKLLTLMIVVFVSVSEAKELSNQPNVTSVVAGQPNLKINVQWGSSNVGSTQYGEKLTAYIAVTNTGKVDCYPPAGAKFVLGAYYKTLGLMKATSVGAFPSVIKVGETKHFIQQSLDVAHQAVIYNGYVDFYVSSQAPGQPDLSAAVRPACNGEVNLTDNNAHSVKKIITNP